MAQPRDSIVTQIDTSIIVTFLFEDEASMQQDSSGLTGLTADYIRTEEEVDSIATLRWNTRQMNGASFPASPITDPVGKIPFETSVSPTGARIISIPIMAAPGWKNAPAISLAYSSQAGNGCAGFGWSVRGISAISVRSRNLYFDSECNSVPFDDHSAVYSLDGIPLKSSSLVSGYDLETVRGHIQVCRHNLANNCAAYFTALFPDGSTAVFGYENANEPDYTYPLTSITDKYGHTACYTYTLYDGAYYIQSISYGEGASLTFDYEYRTDSYPYMFSVSGKNVNGTGRLLKNIHSFDGQTEIATYSLTHQIKDGVQILTNVSCSSGGCTLKPLEFSYGFTGDSSSESFIKTDESFLRMAYVQEEGKGLVYKRGRLRPGRFDDGLIVYPDRKNYDSLGHRRALFSSNRSYWCGSQYGSYDIILYYPDIKSSGQHILETTGEGFQTMDAVDVDGNGVDELVKLNCSGLSGQRTRFNVTLFSFGSYGPATTRSFSFDLNDGTHNKHFNNPAKCWYRYGRFRGDGKYMLLVLSRDNSKVAIVDLASESGNKIYEGSLFTVNDFEIGNIFIADFENDGQDDVCVVDQSGLKVYSLSGGTLSYRTTYQGASKRYLCSLPGTPYDGITGGTVPSEIHVVDINGDGYQDIISYPLSLNIYGSLLPNYSWHIARFNGKSFSPVTETLCYKSSKAPVYFFDADDDGLPEMFIAYKTQNLCYKNINGQFSTPIESIVPVPAYSSVMPCRIASTIGGPSISVISGNTVKFYSCRASHQKRRLLTLIEDGFGNSVHDEYGNIMNEDGSYLASPQPLSPASGFMKYPFPLYVVDKSWSASGDKVVADRSYLYRDAIVSRKGLGFCGFETLETTDFLSGETLIQRLSPEALCSVSRIERRKTAPSQLLYSEDYVYETKTSHGIDFPRLKQSSSLDNLSLLSTSTQYSYDSYDFPTSVVTVRSNGVGTPKKEKVERSYSHSLSSMRFILGAVKEESLIREGDADTTYAWKERCVNTLDSWFRPVEQRRYVGEYGHELKEDSSVMPDINGPGTVMPPEIVPFDPSLEEQPEYPDPPFEPGEPGEPGPVGPGTVPSGGDEAFFDSTLYVFRDASFLVEKLRWQYDEHGNVTREESAPYESAVYVGESYYYDGFGRELLSKTDALGHVTQYGNYNKFGKPGLITDWRFHRDTLTYDSWGNLIRRASADGTIEETLTAWGGSGLYTVTRRKTGSPETVSHYDALGREILSGEKRFDGSWLWKKSEYDTLGRQKRVSLPYKGEAPAYWNSYAYDDYGRLVSLTETSGKVSSWAYDGASTTSVRDGISSTKTVDANGDVVQITDGGGTLVYSLRDDRQPSSVTVHGNVVTSFEYDSLGRRMSIIDPSAGIQRDTVVWSADGTSYSVHTGPNGSVTTRFDCYGRTSSVEREGAHNTSYQYDSDGMLLAEISDNACSRRYSYDAFGRVSSVRDTVPDNKWLLREFAYKAGSQIDSIRFSSQDGYITTETFNYANGHNVGIRLPGNTPVWALVSENAEGRVSEIVTGGISRTYGFTPSGLPTYRKMAGGSLQDFSYQFDPMTGNLLSRSDLVNNTLETFAYDTLGRLVAMGPRSISYDAKGNATNIGGVGYLYYGDDSHPYRVTGYSPATPALEAAFDQRAGYTSFNRPSYISEGGKRADFVYGGDDARVKMQIKRNGWQNLLSRYYIADCYEYDQTSTVTRERLYLGGDAYSAPMVLLRENGGSWTLYNIGRDYLGSITHIATADGTLVAEYSYDPWGRQRNPQTQAVYAAGMDPELFLGRGFTGHEHLRDFCLINMNARLYDPVLGRFLSPDPYVQAPDFTQNFNRYSYALNNPLKYTDESGESVLAAILIGAAVSAIIDYGVQVAFNAYTVNHDPRFAGMDSKERSRYIWWDNIDWFDVVSSAVFGGITAGVGTASSMGKSLTRFGTFILKNPGLVSAIEIVSTSAIDITNEGIQEVTGKQFVQRVATAYIARIARKTVSDAFSEVGSNVIKTQHAKTKPYQTHHFITNKNKFYTPQMEEIVSTYGLNLDDDWNKAVLPHIGRHPNEYHEFILQSLFMIDYKADGDQQLFLDFFNIYIKQVVIENPDILYKSGWR